MRIALLVAALLLVPYQLEASTLYVEFALPFNYGDLEFGPAVGSARIVDQQLLQEDGGEIWGPFEVFPIIGGTLNLQTGALLEVVPLAYDADYFHAGGGTLAIAFDLELPDGSTHHGTYEAPLGPYVVHGQAWDTFGTLGNGLFDPGTAQLLGINRHTLETDWLFYLDLYDSYPAPYRVAKSFGYINIPVVPEPATLWLLGLGLAFGVRRAMR